MSRQTSRRHCVVVMFSAILAVIGGCVGTYAPFNSEQWFPAAPDSYPGSRPSQQGAPVRQRPTKEITEEDRDRHPSTWKRKLSAKYASIASEADRWTLCPAMD